MPILILSLMAPAGLLASALDCHDTRAVEAALSFARHEFKIQGQAAVMPPFTIVERPAGSGTYVAHDRRNNDEVAEVLGRMSGDVFIIHKMAVRPTRDRAHPQEVSPGAPYRILESLRQRNIVKNLQIQVNTEVFEVLQQQQVPLPEHFMAHWAGFDLTAIKKVPLYNIDDPGYQTWLVFQAKPPEDPNDKLRPGFRPRPAYPTSTGDTLNR